MKIAPNMVATIHYTLSDAKGELIESSRQEDGEPLVYIHGTGNLISGLEDKLAGKSKGDKLLVAVKAEDAYGERDESLIETVEKSEFDDTEELNEGKEFQYDDEDGNIFHVRIVKIDGDNVTVDGNHPLAGIAIRLHMQIEDVRAATADELSQRSTGSHFFRIEPPHVQGDGGFLLH
jgi:FKBP-type peptidyl-prolyl cis-trans isomerase SlyD